MWALETSTLGEDRELRRVARKICDLCPIQFDCLAQAVENHYNDGIFGGLTYQERKALRHLLPFPDRAGEKSEPQQGRRLPMLTSWLAAHPQVIAEARKLGAKRFKRIRQQQRYHEQKKSAPAVPHTVGRSPTLF
ncbi:WhiB family transcriptional regulator [Bifidobacterium xylocopae]|nr:WhiB family transcriptional regulator [Bifidobacterium xylocopae]